MDNFTHIAKVNPLSPLVADITIRDFDSDELTLEASINSQIIAFPFEVDFELYEQTVSYDGWTMYQEYVFAMNTSIIPAGIKYGVYMFDLVVTDEHGSSNSTTLLF